MPRRWLSLRGYQKEPKDVVVVTDGHFDFDFSCPSALASPTSPTCTTPAMFGTQNRSKRIKRSPSRPQTSDGPRHGADRRLQLTKVDDSWIGVAFGSPTHPPAFGPSLTESEVANSSNHAFRLEGPLPAIPQTTSRYKKLGNMFKLRSTSTTLPISAPMNVYRLDGESQRDVAAPLMRQLPDLPKQGSQEPDVANEERISFADRPLQPASPVQSPSRSRTELPRLEIQIPSVELDRYSVMFKNVSGIKPSSLLERRSRNLSNLKLATATESEIPPVPAVNPPPVPTPTTPKARASYSLFPTQCQAASKTYQSPERKGLRSRSTSGSGSRMSEPAQPLPVEEESITKHLEHHTPTQSRESESTFTSPDDTVVSSETDDVPWRSVDSLPSVPSSRTSVGSELFFDLKPFRNSSGEEQAEYIIHKPDTPEVARAMSRSHRAKKSQLSEEAVVMDFDVGPDLQAAEYMLRSEEDWRLSAQLNQAIAEVQRLTSPSTSESPPIELASPEIFQPKLKPSELMPAIRLRKRLEGLAIGIPSPITERSEASPRTPSVQRDTQTAQSLPPNAYTQQRSHVAALSIKPVPLNTDSERLSEAFFDVPPPVPKKDRKFLPVSKYAIANPSTKTSAQEPQKIRRKPHRVLTDSAIVTSTSTGDVRQQQSQLMERATSLPPTLIPPPLIQSQQQSPSCSSPTPSSTTLSPRTHISTSISNSIAKAMLMPSIAAPPTAEVSTARKISLTRKQSHQILLSRASAGKVDEKTESTENVVDGTTRRLSPEVKEVAVGHRPGRSVNLIVECAD